MVSENNEAEDLSTNSKPHLPTPPVPSHPIVKNEYSASSPIMSLSPVIVSSRLRQESSSGFDLWQRGLPHPFYMSQPGGCEVSNTPGTWLKVSQVLS